LPISSKSFEKKVCLTAFAESEFYNGLANSDLPKRSETFKKSMPDGICRIGIRQPIGCLTAFAESEFGNPVFCYRLLLVNEIKSEKGVDEEVNHQEERHPPVKPNRRYKCLNESFITVPMVFFICCWRLKKRPL